MSFSGGGNSAQALNLGTTYDKNNWEEVKDFLIPQVQEWVKRGEFTIPIGKCDYGFTFDEKYLKKSQENEGKYDINNDGVMISKATGSIPEYLYGLPFPTIDPQDPKIASKIIENFLRTVHYRQGSTKGNGYINWIGTRGLERRILVQENFLYYQNRRRGPLLNPKNYLCQQLAYVLSPFDLRGVVQMAWTYNSPETDTAFSYVPMLRRIRRMSAAAKSDGFAGSDLTIDDSCGYSGKNSYMTWKLVGQGNILVPFLSPQKDFCERLPDGSFKRHHHYVTKGYDTPGWPGAQWAPTNLSWYPRPVWIVEAVPKDPYYSAGKLIHYIDKDNYNMFFKVAYDHSGEYWKTVTFPGSCSETEEGTRYFSMASLYLIIDDRNHHSTGGDQNDWEGEISKIDLPPDVFSPSIFTEANIRQISK